MSGLVCSIAVNAIVYGAGVLTGLHIARRNSQEGSRMIRRLNEGRRRLVRWFTDSRVIAIVASLAFIIASWTVVSQARTVDCLQDYLDSRDAAQAPRTQANVEKDAALNVVIVAASDALKGDQVAINGLSRALQNYEAKYAELERERAENPAPPPPTVLCED